MSKVFLAAAVLVLAAQCPAIAQEGAAEASQDWSAAQWREAARGDVLEAYRQFVENHPGVYDLANPNFLKQLGEARSAGLAAAEQASDRISYNLALARFSAVLSDGHANAYTPNSAAQQDAPRYWPGFAALWRGDKLLVRTQQDSDPLHGAAITACDGEPIKQFLAERMPLQGARPTEQGQWWVRPSQLFYSIGPRAAYQPKNCTFTLKDGTSQTQDLNWRTHTQEDRDFYGDNVFPNAEPIGLTEPRDGVFVIGLGDFSPEDEGRALYEALYEEVAARRDELLAAHAVVLDLRGNNGGSSQWSRKLTTLLWGEDALRSRYPDIEGIDWRASTDTIAYLGEMRAEFVKNGEQEMADWVGQAIAGMQAAHDAGLPLWREGEGEETHARRTPTPTDFTVPVYVVNWGLCASACLDANDYFGLFDNTKLIGAPTSADSTYMEVRGVKLPNGPGWLTIPNKTWVGRMRDWGEIYEPDIVMDQLDWSTDAFLDRIERDLPPR